MGLAGGMAKGGDSGYENSGVTVSIKPKPVEATLYLMRNFGRHFGLYLGGGPDPVAYIAEVSGTMAGLTFGQLPFKGKVSAAHAEAGMVFAIKNLSLRFSVRRIFSGDSGEISGNVNGVPGPGKYKLIVKNDKTLDLKPVGQSLAANEKPFKLDFGGTAAAVSLSYSFANW